MSILFLVEGGGSCFFFSLAHVLMLFSFSLLAKDAGEFQEYNSVIFTSGISFTLQVLFCQSCTCDFRIHMTQYITPYWYLGTEVGILLGPN